jgi:hypothetical protein
MDKISSALVALRQKTALSPEYIDRALHKTMSPYLDDILNKGHSIEPFEARIARSNRNGSTSVTRLVDKMDTIRDQHPNKRDYSYMDTPAYSRLEKQLYNRHHIGEELRRAQNRLWNSLPYDAAKFYMK